jgi:DNA-binding transcriptional LysR family regulator
LAGPERWPLDVVWRWRNETRRSGKVSLRLRHKAFEVGDLRLLLALKRERSLTRAARQLGVDHSNAFRRLGALEARLGVRLFERARDGYAPTAAGELAIASAERVDAELTDVERRLAGEDLRPAGVVRLTSTDTLVELLEPMLRELRREQPGIVVELVTANAFFTLTRRDADVAVRPAASAPEGLVARRISAVASAVYGAPAHVRSHRGKPLAEQPWIGVDESLAHLASARWMAAEIPEPLVVHRVSSLWAAQVATRAGFGLAVLPCFSADVDRGLRRVGAPHPEWASSLWLLTHPDLRRVARIRAVLDFLAVRLAEKRPLLEGDSARRG